MVNLNLKQRKLINLLKNTSYSFDFGLDFSELAYNFMFNKKIMKLLTFLIKILQLKFPRKKHFVRSLLVMFTLLLLTALFLDESGWYANYKFRLKLETARSLKNADQQFTHGISPATQHYYLNARSETVNEKTFLSSVNGYINHTDFKKGLENSAMLDFEMVIFACVFHLSSILFDERAPVKRKMRKLLEGILLFPVLYLAGRIYYHHICLEFPLFPDFKLINYAFDLFLPVMFGCLVYFYEKRNVPVESGNQPPAMLA